MHGILHVTLIVAISLYVQVDTRGYVFHPPQPWVLSKRTLQDSEKLDDNSSQQARSQEGGHDQGYLVYSSGNSREDGATTNDNSNEAIRFRSEENVPSDSIEYQENYGIEKQQRNRYRDEPLDGMHVEDDEDYQFDYRQNQPQQQSNQAGYSDHSPYPSYQEESNDDGYDGYDQEDSYNDQNSYANDLQMDTNAEPYDDEVAAKEAQANANQGETYSLEYTQTDLDPNSSNTNKDKNEESKTANKEAEKTSKESSSNDSKAKGDEGSESEEDDYNDDDDDDYYEDDDGDYDDYADDIPYDSGGGGKGKKGKRGGGMMENKRPNAPFWGPQDYLLGDHKGQGFAVQGPPVFFEEGKPQWPPEEPQGGGRGRKGGKGGKGGKGKGKGKKGKKGGGGVKKGWHQGWGGWERIGNGGWGEWPKGWISGINLDTGGQRWVDGKGWVGGTGAPWIPKREVPHTWGFPLGWKMEDRGRGGKKGGKGGKKGKGKGKKKKKKNKKKKKKCKKRKGRKGGKGGKKKKGGDCGGKTGWGWPKPHFLKLKPKPPRGSQVWLKSGGGWSKKPQGGWHPSRGWDILRKVTGGGGWMLPDLVGVVHLNG